MVVLADGETVTVIVGVAPALVIVCVIVVVCGGATLVEIKEAVFGIVKVLVLMTGEVVWVVTHLLWVEVTVEVEQEEVTVVVPLQYVLIFVVRMETSSAQYTACG